jgi:hypothetical protein
MAMATAFVVFAAPSFATIDAVCAPTVRWVIPKMAPICRAVFPCANKDTTSISRGVRADGGF